jgi:hypothetical protein
MTMLTTFLFLAATAVAQAATPAPQVDYATAKALADKDEASLPRVGLDALRTAQSGVLNRATDACKTDETPKPFTVVIELDAKGKPVGHWRDGDSKLAQCMEDKLTRQMFYVPPRAPFHVSFEVTFTK